MSDVNRKEPKLINVDKRITEVIEDGTEASA